MIQRFDTLQDAIELAKFGHRKQTDKGGQPYIGHPMRVLEKVQSQGAPPDVQIAAVLHDLSEDSLFTPEMLLELGIPESAVEIIKLVDRDYSEDEFYDSFGEDAPVTKYEITDYYYECIRNNPGALMVKLADIEDNLSPWRLSYLTEETQTRLKKKYARAREILSYDRHRSRT